MSTRLRGVITAVALVALVLAPGTSSAVTTNKLIKVKEVYPGSSGIPNSQFIELQMFASGQKFFSATPAQVVVYDATGNPVVNGTFSLSADLTNGKDQSTLLLATTQAEAEFAVTSDVLMGSAAVIPFLAGKICYIPSNAAFTDCFYWGAYTGLDLVGTAFNSVTGLDQGKVVVRRTSRSPRPCALDASTASGSTSAGDDTNDSATDFMTQVADFVDQTDPIHPQPNSVLPSRIGGCARVIDGKLKFDAAPGINDNVEFSCSGGNPCGQLADSADEHLTAGDGCWQKTNDKVVCPDVTLTSAKINGHDGRNKLDAAVDVPTTLIGGDIHDALFAVGTGADTLKGGGGDDIIEAQDDIGNDTLQCGDGNDSFSADHDDVKIDCEKKLP